MRVIMGSKNLCQHLGMIDIYSLVCVCLAKNLMKGQFMGSGCWALKVCIELHMGVLYMVVH